MRPPTLAGLPSRCSEHDRPVSVIMPAFNEEALIETAVSAVRGLEYQQFEIVVVNDGSTDRTLEVMIERFEMDVVDEPLEQPIPTMPVRAQYQSRRYPNLRLIDKENGGKPDASNAGINAAQYGLVCMVDSDSILQPDTLRRIARPFVDDWRTVAVGGTIRIANGSRVSSGLLLEARLPRRLLPLIQIVEYLRAFLFGRFGWDSLNGVLIISGALGLFDREVMLNIGGYRTDTVGEDFELTVRIHRMLSAANIDYRIVFIPDPIAWTEAPEHLRALGRQRIRWQRGALEALMMNRSMLFARGTGAAGWLNFPFQLVFECFGPIIEFTGYVYFVVALLLGRVSPVGLLAFMVLAVGVGMFLSAMAVLLEEMSFRMYPKVRHVAMLVAVVIIENIGYRQLVALWRIIGLAQWMTGKKTRYAPITRTATWAGDVDARSG
jgi:cellulose synthase/poly-beta-1,6-N-acetylglucosamine synthase-like glycosyltransferase